MNKDDCVKCRYKETNTNEYPCNQCKSNYINKFEPLPDLSIYDLVVIKDDITHDTGYKGSIGVVKQVNNSPCNDISENYYYVVGYDKRAERYWSCGFNRSELIETKQDLQGLIESVEYWKKN